MGTNYYYRYTEDECGEQVGKELHIGKSSSGWTFSFRGHHNLGIRSWEDWQLFIESKGGSIINEYGGEISLDDLRELVDSKKDGRNHSVEYPKSCYLDSEGHSITYYEFS